jgi:hypothetical protein
LELPVEKVHFGRCKKVHFWSKSAVFQVQNVHVEGVENRNADFEGVRCVHLRNARKLGKKCVK